MTDDVKAPVDSAPVSGSALAEASKSTAPAPEAKPEANVTPETNVDGAEGKKEEVKADPVPEKYEFKDADAAVVEKATPLFKELGLSQAQAQKLVDFQALQNAESAKALQAQAEKWRAEVKALPESDKLLGDAVLALDKLADPETASMIKNSWLGDQPGIVKLLAKAGKLLREDPLHEGTPAAGGAPTDIADRMFGDTFKK
jgi:hypothetical protein